MAMVEVEKLSKKIKEKKAKIGVIGLGYVGLPLAIRFAEVGFKVWGFDVDKNKIRKLHDGQSYIKHIPCKTFSDYIEHNRLIPTTDFDYLRRCDIIIICVPTPLSKHREPEMHYVRRATMEILQRLDLKKSQLINLTSTSYPGTTEEFITNELRIMNWKVGEKVFVSYCPEREDPNNKKFELSNTTKIVSGETENCLRLTQELYSEICPTFPVSNPKIAEAAKLLENIYRSVNIALVNELKLIFDRMGIDVFEVIDAAKTKPFGFQAFYPGPGLGGHCIPIDPFYLTWKAKEYDYSTRFIQLAGEINNHVSYFVLDKVITALNSKLLSLRGSKILILGVSYKPDIDDDRESPAYKIMAMLLKRGCRVYFHDPYIKVVEKEVNGTYFYQERVDLKPEDYHCVVICTDHSNYDYNEIVKKSNLVVDTRNATKGIVSEKIFKA